MSAGSSGLFTVKEINRIKTLQDVIDRWLTPGRAAEHLGITPRHCSRLLKRYREHGPLGINNRSRGNPGNRLLPRGFTDQALEIIRKNYPDFWPTLAREKLEEIHGLVLGKETVRRLMINAGLWVPRKMRPPKIHQPRYRRPCTGELIQIDGCDHDWFECRPAEVDGLWLVACSRGYGMESMRVKDEPLFALFEIKEQNGGERYCIDPMNGYALIHTTVQEDIFRGMFVCNETARDGDLAEYYDEIGFVRGHHSTWRRFPGIRRAFLGSWRNPAIYASQSRFS